MITWNSQLFIKMYPCVKGKTGIVCESSSMEQPSVFIIVHDALDLFEMDGGVNTLTFVLESQ